MNSKKIGIQRVVEIPLEEVQTATGAIRKHLTGQMDTYLICGKLIKGEQKNVQLLTNGNIVSSDQDFENSQGFFPVGSNCAKKLVLHFAF